jgi:type II secretory ATPase GspE/PulE/Tfp pilus assembly ATPase PilB-like protein
VAVLAQRLVRTICPDCRRPVANPEAVFAKLKLDPPADTPLRLWKGEGCLECKQSGYRGRQAIFELMMVDERFHDPIVAHAGAQEYVRLARERGMKSLFEDGLRKVLAGNTTIEELLEATRAEG